MLVWKQYPLLHLKILPTPYECEAIFSTALPETRLSPPRLPPSALMDSVRLQCLENYFLNIVKLFGPRALSFPNFLNFLISQCLRVLHSEGCVPPYQEILLTADYDREHMLTVYL